MHKVVMLPVAERDLEDIVDYLSGFYSSTAINKFDRIVEHINSLSEYPNKHEVYMGGAYRFEYRKMVVDDYLVFYVVFEDSVEIHRILHGRLDIQSRLRWE